MIRVQGVRKVTEMNDCIHSSGNSKIQPNAIGNQICPWGAHLSEIPIDLLPAWIEGSRLRQDRSRYAYCVVGGGIDEMR